MARSVALLVLCTFAAAAAVQASAGRVMGDEASSLMGGRGAGRHLLQSGCDGGPNQRTNVDGALCCFPYEFEGVEYNDCLAIGSENTGDQDTYCMARSDHGARGTLTKCAPLSGVSVTELNRDAGGSSASEPAEEERAFDAQKFLDGIRGAPAPAPSAAAFDAQKFLDGIQNFTETPTPAVRYAVDGSRCVFGLPAPNGTVVYDCFSLAEDADVAAAVREDGDLPEYCIVDADRRDVYRVCADRGVKPGEEAEAAEVEPVIGVKPLCAGVGAVRTVTGGRCTFPQLYTTTDGRQNWTCGCYDIHLEVSYDDEPRLYCQVDGGAGRVDVCVAPADVEAARAAASEEVADGGEGEDDDDDGDGGSNAAVIAVAIAVPLGVLALVGAAGGLWWYKKKRPAARATSFTKFDDSGASAIKGGAISSQDVRTTGQGLSSVSKYAEPI